MTCCVDGHEQAGAARVVAHMRGSSRRRYHGSTWRRREVDAGVHVAGRTQRIERLQLERRAAERLSDHRAFDDHVDRKPRLIGQVGRRENPGEARRRGDENNPRCGNHAARRTACSTWLTLWWRSDSSLWATFSALPIAPGTLNTTSRAARAKAWRSGLKPLFSSANPIAMTNSCTGCMNRLVTKSFCHSLARCAVSGSERSTHQGGAEIARTISTV